MEFEILLELISNVGFPIVACGALFWSNHSTAKRYEAILLNFRSTLDDNTNAIRTLCEKIK